MNQSIYLNTIRELYPAFTFKNSNKYYWSPLEQVIYYNDTDNSETGVWALIHELSHALLGHTTFRADIELLIMESEAWEKAQYITQEHGLTLPIDEDHIQDCLDTYRDWLYARSMCPACSLTGIQKDTKTYTCLNCQQHWKVSSSRFNRPYRMCIHR